MPQADEPSEAEAVSMLPQSTLPAEQLLQRMLDLINNSASAADLTLDRVARSLEREFTTDSPTEHHSVARLTPDWLAGVTVDQGPNGPYVELAFFDNDGLTEPDMTDICGLDVDQFVADLEQHGFEAQPVPGMHGGVIGFELTRGQLQVDLGTRGESSSPPAKVTHSCIVSVAVR